MNRKQKRSDEANQRVAAARILGIKVAESDVASAILSLLETWNAAADERHEAKLATMGRIARWANSDSFPPTRHFHALDRSDHLLITYGVTATRVAERGLNPVDRAWAATLAVCGRDDALTHVKVVLSKWSVDDEGLIWNGGRYVALLDGLVHGLDGRYISDPIEEADHRFVSYS